MDWKYENGRIYSVDEKGELLAETTYIQKENGEADIGHTYVNPLLRRQGIADKMMEAVAEYFRKEGLRTTASCSYAHIWLNRNQEKYASIISKKLDDQTLACKIDSKH